MELKDSRRVLRAKPRTAGGIQGHAEFLGSATALEQDVSGAILVRSHLRLAVEQDWKCRATLGLDDHDNVAKFLCAVDGK